MNNSLDRKITASSLLKFTIPSTAMIVFMYLYVILDGIIVSKFLGANAFAALSIVNPPVSMVMGLGMLLGIGLTEVVSHSLGEGRPEEANQKFTLDRATEQIIATFINGYAGSEVVDDHTIIIETESYNNEFLQSLTTVMVLSQDAYESGMEHPEYIGTGPYRFDEWIQGQYCRVTKVDDYWAATTTEEIPDYYGQGVSDAIEFRPYIEPSSRVIALQAGEVDVCINPPINELQYLESDDNIVVHEEPGTRLFYFAFNVTKEPWNNQTLRQAVACAIDRESVLQAAVEGKGTLQSANHSRQINKGHGLSCYSFFMISHGLIYISFRSTR